MKKDISTSFCLSSKRDLISKNIVYVTLILSACIWMSCEREEDFSKDVIVLPPVTPQEIVRVPSDDGVLRVNSLTKAIAANGEAVYELERGGVYYMEGKNVIKHKVTIKAAQGSGHLPIIQPISDAQGVLNADMLRLEKSVVFENIYFIGRDAAVTGSIMQRLFRLDASGLTLKLEGCFVEYCKNFCIRADDVDNKIYINNSTLRNFALTSDPANGRLFDSRGNAQDTISITNSTIYNNTGHTVRFDGAFMNHFEFLNNTVYNVGYHMRIDYAMNVVIENNIFANVGWKAGYTASAPGSFWDIKAFTDDNEHKMADVRMSIRNNNVFSSPEIRNLYVKYPGNIERVALNSTATDLIADGRMIYENNISEVLGFDHPSPLPMQYIDKFFEVLNTGMAAHADLPFFVDEDGLDGFVTKERFTFRYPASSVSATASTSGGYLGAPMWHP